MKVLIIGGVAAGTKVAAKLKREDRSLGRSDSDQGEGHFLRRLRPPVLCGRRDSHKRTVDCEYTGVLLKADRRGGSD